MGYAGLKAEWSKHEALTCELDRIAIGTMTLYDLREALMRRFSAGTLRCVGEFGGMPVYTDDTLPKNTMEFRRPDGSVAAVIFGIGD